MIDQDRWSLFSTNITENKTFYSLGQHKKHSDTYKYFVNITTVTQH